ncbi:MAG: hypothetical protein H7240_03405 [Glaciimonas sp.]|nr:hypothetical protein [Glaciimonas sp.]
MNNFKFWPITTLCIAAISAMATPLVQAQQPANFPNAVNLAPPPLELDKLEKGEKPAITIQKNDKPKEAAITQQRQQGVVTDIKVHSGGSTYHLRPKQVGTSMPGNTPSAPANGAQWVIKEFDWGQRKEKSVNPGEEQAVDNKIAPAPPNTPAE